MPHSFNGLSATMNLIGHLVTLVYNIQESSFGPKAISINGNVIKFMIEQNKYRQGGAVIPTDQFLAMMNQQDNIVEISL